mgnify:CR=1 FL=1
MKRDIQPDCNGYFRNSALLGQWMYAKDYKVSGPQGGLAMTLTLHSL